VCGLCQPHVVAGAGHDGGWGEEKHKPRRDAVSFADGHFAFSLKREIRHIKAQQLAHTEFGASAILLECEGVYQHGKT